MTVVFDFDSTLISCESLDELLSELLVDRPEDAARVRAITIEGMEGHISYCESLTRRLAIARPTREQVEAFGARAVAFLTPGMDALVARLGDAAWIVSGALEEAVWPAAERLGIPRERVMASSLDRECLEKHELVATVAVDWSAPRIAVGDGMSDYALLREGLVDHFIAFTAHVRREAVVATGAPEAHSVSELEYALARLQ